MPGRRKKIFVCSRYAGNVERNVAVAKELCRAVIEDGGIPFAPHLLYPRFLDDHDPEQRAAGIACGLAFMAVCDQVWVYTGNGISRGMWQEIAQAERLGIKILYWYPNLNMKGVPHENQQKKVSHENNQEVQ